MPAYNAEKTLASVFHGIPAAAAARVLLVDDASTDKTVDLARQLNISVKVHPQNRGYGANQKTCYAWALQEGADIVVMLHPDGQYSPAHLLELTQPLISGQADMVMGSRMMVRADARKGGMPWWKYGSNIFLGKIANMMTAQQLQDWHSGYRAYTRQTLLETDFTNNPDGFAFDIAMALKALQRRKVIKEIPIATRYFPEASSIGLGASIVYGLNFLRELIIFRVNSLLK